MSVSAASLKVGDTQELLLVDDLTRTQIVMYAGASGDYNPLHSDEKFAREVAGYPGIFAHGMLSMGMTGRIVTDWFGDGRLTKYGVRFVRQVWPGDTLTATATVDAIREEDGVQFADVSIVTVNQDGTTVVSGFTGAGLNAALQAPAELFVRDSIFRGNGTGASVSMIQGTPSNSKAVYPRSIFMAVPLNCLMVQPMST